MAFNWRVDKKPIDRDVFDDEGNRATVQVVRFSERDIRNRQKFLSAPASEEETRRGRSARGRDQSIQIQRLRQFNFEAGLHSWPFVYPDETWSEEQGRYVPEPKAGQPVPIVRKEIEDMDARISEQIDDILSEVNEPPEELPEIRDESGNLIEEATESPLVENSAVR